MCGLKVFVDQAHPNHRQVGVGIEGHFCACQGALAEEGRIVVEEADQVVSGRSESDVPSLRDADIFG